MEPFNDDLKQLIEDDMERVRMRPPISFFLNQFDTYMPKEMEIPDEALKIELAGRRCILLQDTMSGESEGTFGSKIIIPDTARQPLGAGWIINIGLEWALPGQPDDRSTFFNMFTDRWDVIGRKVLFGDWVGQDLFFSLTDRRFQSKFKVLSEHEIWGLVERT